MGWIALLAFFVLAFGALWRFGNMPAAGLQTCAAALLMGCIGYAWQGSPDLPSAPAVALETPHTQHPEQIMRKAMMGAFGGSAQILDVADVLIRDHDTADAVGLLQNTVKQYPQNADLWVGFGNALVAHNGSMISPAARFAFDRAAELSPAHPAPPFFKGLALAQSGQIDDAQVIWKSLLARTPADAPWRKDLIAKLTMVSAPQGQ